MPGWARLIVAVAALRVGLVLALYLSNGPAPGDVDPAPGWVFAGLSTTYAVLGLVLAIGNKHDRRASWLGGLFLLIASPMVVPLLGPLDLLVQILLAVSPEAFLGAFLWSFVLCFPSTVSGRSLRLGLLVVGVIAVQATALTLVNLSAVPLAPAPGSWRVPLLSWSRPSLFWPLTLGMMAPAFLVLVRRLWHPAASAKWSVRLFGTGLVAGVLPFSIQVIAEQLIPRYRAYAHSPGVEPWIGGFLYASLALVPLITTYSVLFDRVVAVRVVLRAALQYALARYTIISLAVVPFVALAVFLFERRAEPLTAILSSGPRPFFFLALMGGGVAALQLRGRWLEALDRRYFREPYDSRQILSSLVGEVSTHSIEHLATRIRTEIEQALHAPAALFFVNEARTLLTHTGNEQAPVSMASTLLRLALADREPMDVDLMNVNSPWRRLPEDERAWLVAGGFRILVAMRDADGQASGLLAVGAKRSGLEFSREDRRLLSAIAGTTGLALEASLHRTPQTPDESPGQECRSCSRLSGQGATRCSCGGALEPALVPHMLRGVFRIDQRIGAGGMGVVYRGVDLNLGREVAIKALPRVTPRTVARLQREARAMAAVGHTNLAVIYGVETWRHTPFLVQEYLAGGTLAQRLSGGPLPVQEVLTMGLTLCEALEHLHRGGIVHLDIKPSNIGFTRDHIVKLFDFGLARVLVTDEAGPDAPTTERRRPHASSASTVTAGPFGTPAYMSPEAIAGEAPAPTFDVWALAVVLYEALAGRRPFEGNGFSVLARVGASAPPEITALRPGLPSEFGEFFAAALAGDPGLRPPSVAALKEHLSQLLAHRG